MALSNTGVPVPSPLHTVPPLQPSLVRSPPPPVLWAYAAVPMPPEASPTLPSSFSESRTRSGQTLQSIRPRQGRPKRPGRRPGHRGPPW